MDESFISFFDTIVATSTFVEVTGGLLSVTAVVIGVLTAVIATKARSNFKVIKVDIDSLGTFRDRAKLVTKKPEDRQLNKQLDNSQLENETRISDVRGELAKQEFKAKWAGYSSTALKFSQYIIGGLLASSFIQESVEPKYIGSLGVIVLVASLVNQNFKPDVRHRGSRQRAAQLKALLRDSEDHVYAIKNEVSGSKSLFEIRRAATTGLNQIEEMELLDYELHEEINKSPQNSK